LDREKARLRRLEEEAANRRRQAPPSGAVQATRPNATRSIGDRGYEEWRRLMKRHGWTDEQLDEEQRWTTTVLRRCDEAGFDSLDMIRDMLAYVDARNLPLSEMKDAFDDYPGPRPYWAGPGGVG
jgi:hypothetical protein